MFDRTPVIDLLLSLGLSVQDGEGERRLQCAYDCFLPEITGAGGVRKDDMILATLIPRPIPDLTVPETRLPNDPYQRARELRSRKIDIWVRAWSLDGGRDDVRQKIGVAIRYRESRAELMAEARKAKKANALEAVQQNVRRARTQQKVVLRTLRSLRMLAGAPQPLA